MADGGVPQDGDSQLSKLTQHTVSGCPTDRAECCHMGTPPYYFGRREQNDFHRKPACGLFQQFDVLCVSCDSHHIKLVAEADDDGLKVYLFCLGCKKREELPMH